MTALRWGFKTSPQHTTWDAIRAVWLEGDRTPAFEHAWLFDHLNPIEGDPDGPCLEGWTTLTALAAITERIRVGLMVAGNTYRHPALHAHMAATADVISHGRIDFGIGAGWNEYEHASKGIPLHAPGERIRRLDEACEVVRLLWTQPVADFDGRWYHLAQARLAPKPVQKPYPPIVIGGNGEKLTLRVVAKHADIWNFSGTDPDELRRKQAVLREHCAAVGRDPAEIEVSVQVRADYDDPSTTVATLRPLIDAGATHLVLMLAPPYPAGVIARLAEDVVGAF